MSHREHESRRHARQAPTSGQGSRGASRGHGTHLPSRQVGDPDPQTRKPGRLPKDVAAVRQTGIRVTTKEGGHVPMVSKMRVLGLWLEENGANSELVTWLQKKVAPATN
ncbi:hypothetical protein MTO96_045118 [Rhipicephalus appendiculatus]